MDTSIDLIILHYVGDESIVIDFPHGNSHHCQPYYRTCPSVLEKLKNSVDCPGNVYKKAVASNNSPVNYESTTLDEKWNFLIKEMCMTGLNFRHISFFNRKFGPVIYQICAACI